LSDLKDRPTDINGPDDHLLPDIALEEFQAQAELLVIIENAEPATIEQMQFRLVRPNNHRFT
jgi:hypothetical protein